MPSVQIAEDKVVLDELITIIATKMIFRGELNHLIDMLTGLNSPYASFFCSSATEDSAATARRQKKNKYVSKEKHQRISSNVLNR